MELKLFDLRQFTYDRSLQVRSQRRSKVMGICPQLSVGLSTYELLLASRYVYIAYRMCALYVVSNDATNSLLQKR